MTLPGSTFASRTAAEHLAHVPCVTCVVARTAHDYAAMASVVAAKPASSALERGHAGMLLRVWGSSVYTASRMMWEAGRMHVVVAAR